ncbi:hypothetical protein L1987_04922 [Smallanthus sonchifolius]|uniref:Uncharacterized protein n=1 Tax=Smallanthus sonchifolius TaxID=185202 RepID=A0ACB9JTW7_9ASTR|nr:hypothetical protein L1987_04922 [Smallanthus sonchifolius]
MTLLWNYGGCVGAGRVVVDIDLLLGTCVLHTSMNRSKVNNIYCVGVCIDIEKEIGKQLEEFEFKENEVFENITQMCGQHETYSSYFRSS